MTGSLDGKKSAAEGGRGPECTGLTQMAVMKRPRRSSKGGSGIQNATLISTIRLK